MTYYPLPYGGAFTGFIPGGSPYVAGGGYSSGVPAGYTMPQPPVFHDSPNSDWMTPSEAQFERRHLDHRVNLDSQEWIQIIGTSAVAAGLLWLIAIW
jgi:hypothetical protein